MGRKGFAGFKIVIFALNIVLDAFTEHVRDVLVLKVRLGIMPSPTPQKRESIYIK